MRNGIRKEWKVIREGKCTVNPYVLVSVIFTIFKEKDILTSLMIAFEVSHSGFRNRVPKLL